MEAKLLCELKFVSLVYIYTHFGMKDNIFYKWNVLSILIHLSMAYKGLLS